MQSDVLANTPLKTEAEIEEEVSHTSGIFKNFKVAKCELSRFIIYGIMFGIIGFIYSFMRILKDNYVMSRQDPLCSLYIKLLYITPLSFLIVFGINWLLVRRSVSKLFSLVCIIFAILFFALGSLIVMEDFIGIGGSAIKNFAMGSKLEPRGLSMLKYILLTIQQPIATVIFIVAELWGSLILSYLFFSFLNEINTEGQMKRFLPPLFIIANLALLMSASVTTLLLKIQKKLSNEQNVIFMGGVFFAEGLLTLSILFCKYILENKIVTKPIFIPSKVKRSKGPKVSSSLSESLQIMRKSKFLLAMCCVIFAYSVVFNILETVFKAGIKAGAEAAGVEKGAFSSKFNSYDQYLTSISVIVLNLSSFSNLVDDKGWLLVGLITPIIAVISAICILGLGSYNAAAAGTSFSWANKIFKDGPQFTTLECYLGTFCLAAMKIFKYTAFDVTKERISMRIDSKYRPKFKSIYDGIFNKFGKSGGALYGILTTGFFDSLSPRDMSPITSIFVSLFLFIWTFWIFYLAKSFNLSLKTQEPIDIDLVEEDEEKNQEVSAGKELPKEAVVNK